MTSVEQRGEENENAIQQSVSELGCYKMRSQMDTSLLGPSDEKSASWLGKRGLKTASDCEPLSRCDYAQKERSGYHCEKHTTLTFPATKNKGHHQHGRPNPIAAAGKHLTPDNVNDECRTGTRSGSGTDFTR
ncbi:uncharacterized protein N7518_009590 [Penicillium psychrosexuale]|uniref:uncharacterized protein n=1 Tax=Penicillium psychrosexuale TaxID=1002107 RepID=UPI00254562AA|nr:uncharacterized protein N7518_009590 [Penicillium psychrosexuale]KAJ5783913.1 hypothetical protein N7518_009590 [Penicillium psychrosexuale]